MRIFKNIILLFFLMFLCTQANALTVGEIGGDYTADYFQFTGSVAPQIIPLKVVLQPTGVWTVMCKQTIGANTYEYPCYSDVWHLDANSSINLSSAIMCNPLNIDTLFCYVNSKTAGLVMTRNRAYTLNVTKVGNGSGIISSSNGISCGAVCSQSVSPNTVINMVAAPDNGSIFGGWSGCDNINGNTCTMLMTANKTATATFSKQTFLLTVNNGNASNGVVVSSVGNINCGTSCSDSYDYGQQVMLTAYPSSGYKVSNAAGWTCDNVSNVCHQTIAIYNNTTINISFTQ